MVDKTQILVYNSTEAYSKDSLEKKNMPINIINETFGFVLDSLANLEDYDYPDSYGILLARKKITEIASRIKRIVDILEHYYEKPIEPEINLVEVERVENIRVYEQHKNELYEKHLGKYVVIANGKIQAIKDTFEDVKNIALNANHRFIFKVKKKEKIRGVFRWPMMKK